MRKNRFQEAIQINTEQELKMVQLQMENQSIPPSVESSEDGDTDIDADVEDES